MPERLKRLIKTFELTERERSRITLGPNVRLKPPTFKTKNLPFHLSALLLEEQADGTFSTASGLFAKTWVTNPESLQQWIGFSVDVEHAKDDLGVDITSLGFRLSDGTDEFRWNGSAWVVETVLWNTEAEVSTNIGAFPVASKKLQVVINLVTSDDSVTPIVQAVKVLFTTDIEELEDIVWRSFVKDLKEQIRPISPIPVVMPTVAGQLTIDLNLFPLETPYNLVDIDSVYNHSDDPDHFTNLFSSFNSGTNIITLTTAIAAGKQVWIRFIYEPEVAVTTGQEYSEIAKVPAIILSDINLINQGEIGQDDFVADKAAGTAVKLPGPSTADIEITIRALTGSARDQARLGDALKEFFSKNSVVRSRGLDEEYTLLQVSEYDMRTDANQSELHAGRLRIHIVKALFFEKQAVDAFLIQRLVLTGLESTPVVIS